MNPVIEISEQAKAKLPRWNEQPIDEVESEDFPTQFSSFENGVRLSRCGIEAVCGSGSGSASG